MIYKLRNFSDTLLNVGGSRPLDNVALVVLSERSVEPIYLLNVPKHNNFNFDVWGSKICTQN